MRKTRRGAAVLTMIFAVAGCTAMRSSPSAPAQPQKEVYAPPVTIPTVPPRTPTPVGAAPLPTRPLENPEAEKAKAAGKPIGPVITHLGIVRADGKPVEPTTTENGIPVYTNYIGSGFMMVVEAKPGLSNLEVGRRILNYDSADPSKRPDLQVQVNHPLGDGSAKVCDARRPKIGGIPAINPPSFAETKHVAAALNDFACRFETFIESSVSCTLNKYGDFSYLDPETTTQFCMVVARAWKFGYGDTLISARLRDTKGNPGPVEKMILRRPRHRPSPTPRPRTTPKPTPARRRP
jgi:hypothetical protein